MKKSGLYQKHELDGLVETRRNRLTGFMVSIYHNEQAGLDCGCCIGGNFDRTGHDPNAHNDYSTVCEEHNTVCLHRTVTIARGWMAVPDWCEPCQAIMKEAKK